MTRQESDQIQLDIQRLKNRLRKLEDNRTRPEIPDSEASEDCRPSNCYVIPDGYRITHMDADAEKPTIILLADGDLLDEITIPMHPAIAEYLSNHHGGNMKMREIVTEGGRR